MLRWEAASGHQEMEVVVGAVVIAPSSGHASPQAVSEKHGTMCELWPDLRGIAPGERGRSPPVG